MTKDSLQWWDARTMTRVDKTDVAYQAVCVLQDGALVAYSGNELHHFDQARNVTDLGGDITRMERFPVVHLLTGRSPQEVYLAMDRSLERYRLDTRSVEKLETHQLHDEVDEQMASLGDGRFVETDDLGFRIVSGDGSVRELSTPGRDPIHVAVAETGRLWYSHLTARFSSVVVLAELATPGTPSLERKLAGRVIHMAAAARGVAVLVLEVGRAKPNWRLHSFDERGDERWQAEVVPDKAWSPWTLDYAFVGCTDHRVVVAVDDHLLAWDAETGAVVIPAQPEPT